MQDIRHIKRGGKTVFQIVIAVISSNINLLMQRRFIVNLIAV